MESFDADSEALGASFNWLGAADKISIVRIIAAANALPRMGDAHRSRL